MFCLNIEHAQACPSLSFEMTEWIGCFMEVNHIQKLKFKSQLVCEILQFKESCILIGLEVLKTYLKNQIFPRHAAFVESWNTNNTFITK